MTLWRSLWQLFMEYWELALLVLTWLAISIVALRRRSDWKRQRFSEQVNFSLNELERAPDGSCRLLLRTLLEDSAGNVWLNEFGVKEVLRAAERTSVERPFLVIEPQADMDLVQHAVLNVLSQRFSGTFLARAVGVPTKSARFLYGLTWERYGEMRTQKLRVMVAREEVLEALFGAEGLVSSVEVAAESHRPRLRTLAAMYELRHSQDPGKRALVGEVELGVALGAAGTPR